MATYEKATADEASRLLGKEPGATNPAGLGLRLLHEEVYGSKWLRSAWADAPPIITPVIHHLWIPDEEYPAAHFYDVNGAYLSAARNSRLAVGAPELVGTSEEIEPTTVVRATRVSSPFDHLVSRRPDGWYGAAMAKLIVDTGGMFIPGPVMYRFPERHYAMREWAQRLWAARSQATDPQVNKFLKESAVMTIGWLSRKRKDQKLTWAYQPQWRAEIIGQHTAKMARLVMRWRAAGAVVLGVKDDAIAIASYEPDALIACPERDQIGATLGRLKVQFSLLEQHARTAIRAMPTAESPQAWFDGLRKSHGR